MRRAMIAAAAAVVCAGCVGPPSGAYVDTNDDRLELVDRNNDGRDVWYDNERMEECQAYHTEHNGLRCFPEFTHIDGGQLRYSDADCSVLIAWSDVEQESHKYVAYINVELSSPPTVYSIYKIIRRHAPSSGSPATVESFGRSDGDCVSYPKETSRPYLEISYAIHPDEFSALSQ